MLFLGLLACFNPQRVSIKPVKLGRTSAGSTRSTFAGIRARTVGRWWLLRGGGGGYHNFMNHKPWHPGSMQNLEQVWLAEQEERIRQEKIEERMRTLEEERKIEALTKEQIKKLKDSNAAVDDNLNLDGFQDSRLIDINAARKPFDLCRLGDAQLKRELELRDMDTSGTLMDMAVRLFKVQGLGRDQIPDELKAKHTRLPSDDENNDYVNWEKAHLGIRYRTVAEVEQEGLHHKHRGGGTSDDDGNHRIHHRMHDSSDQAEKRQRSRNKKRGKRDRRKLMEQFLKVDPKTFNTKDEVTSAKPKSDYTKNVSHKRQSSDSFDEIVKKKRKTDRAIAEYRKILTTQSMTGLMAQMKADEMGLAAHGVVGDAHRSIMDI